MDLPDIPATSLSLLALMQEGDSPRAEQAWGRFHGLYAPVVRRWCRGRGLDEAAAEDITSEVMVRLVEYLHRYDADQGRFRSWLKTVVANAAADQHRRAARVPGAQGSGDSGVARLLEQCREPETTEDLGRELASSYLLRAAALSAVRARVDETTWKAFHERTCLGRPAADVAAELGLTPGAVYQAAYRVKTMVQTEHRRLCEGETPPRS